MSVEQELALLLRAYFRAEIEESIGQAPVRHPDQTEDCPPLTRFPAAVASGWSAEERRHTAKCTYCQKVIAMQWGFQQPSLWTLAQHAAGTLPDRMAMRIHLEEDQCRRCPLLLESVFVRALAGMLQAHSNIEALAQRASKAVAAFGHVALEGEFATRETGHLPIRVLGAVRAGGGRATGRNGETVRLPFRVRGSSDDGRLTATLRETDDGLLVVNVESPDRGNAGRKVQVEVLGRGVRLSAEIELLDSGQYGSETAYSFGKYTKALAEQLAECALVVVLV